ncbi:metallophosphoesterase [Agrobacterium sp.]|uniref:metallophosphoesterase n=1 Tax=Agrobacterium sp. TaxID=361 RepID=UPI0028A9D436|nr:metallophosphoesterase [Agrobacterium sp.]
MTHPAAPLFSFGIVADPQYANIEPKPDMGRYYANSPQKLDAAIDTFNGEDLSFVVTLGDLIDRDWDSFGAVLSCYDRLRHRSVLLPGNHDFAVDADRLPQVYARLGMPSPWYDFVEQDVRFIVLDGSDVSLFAPPRQDPRREIAATRLETLQAVGAINAQTWNGSLGDEQFAWLEDRLADAGRLKQKVIIFCHYPIFPENAHNLWDAPRILSLLAEHDCFAAWFCGHNHVGNYGEIDGSHFLNFKGMVDTPDENTFAIADVYADRIEISGFGREDSRSLVFDQALVPAT